MKNLSLIAILLFSIIVTSCSSNSSPQTANPNSNNNQITPPLWIQGTWIRITSTTPLTTSPFCKFTTNDFCIISGNTELCNAQNIQQASQAGGTTNVMQTINDSEYSLSMTVQSQTSTYKFIKISPNKIEYVNPTNGFPNISLTKQ